MGHKGDNKEWATKETTKDGPQGRQHRVGHKGDNKEWATRETTKSRPQGRQQRVGHKGDNTETVIVTKTRYVNSSK